MKREVWILDRVAGELPLGVVFAKILRHRPDFEHEIVCVQFAWASRGALSNRLEFDVRESNAAGDATKVRVGDVVDAVARGDTFNSLCLITGRDEAVGVFDSSMVFVRTDDEELLALLTREGYWSRVVWIDKEEEMIGKKRS